MAANDSIILRRDQVAAIEVNELIQFRNLLRQAYEVGVRIRSKMRHNFDDSVGGANVDWSDVETIWGIPPIGEDPGDSVGDDANGKRVFTFIDGAVGSMEGSFQTNAAKELTEVIV